MGSMQFIVFGFVLACVELSDTRFLSITVPTYWRDDVEVKPPAEPEREHSRDSAQQAGMLQADQIQHAVAPLSWKFPEEPVDSVNKPPVKFDLRQRATDNRVAVRCGENKIHVEMTENAFIYAFALVYNPKVSGRSHIIRSQSAVIGVECHYLR
ncbi:zona pellucida sperm-binding protein 3-like isoform X2 [Epinephelus fuscoguttatus]|uniref:zona pellucida sperm-binding protein 3-like isoform X2 n=1 Tax=Epinephelus fuscoguttatus TaxID=293821 RepID=UPI0020D195C0|nr:zona pellucida sperm-binding protein 3-like isoform X2 [Epinephelus fuscoguttatus]